MKIIRLTAENIKKVKAVEITPDGNTVIIAGRNEQGKTSILDAIWYALGGVKGVKKPIRDGEKSAKVMLDLGDFKVERTFSGETTSLKVVSADGKAKFSSPQTLLDGLIGNLSFDPLAFSHMKESAQKETLLGLVDIGIDLKTWEGERLSLYDERTVVNRAAKELDGQLAGLVRFPNAPAEEVKIASITAEMEEARKVYADNYRQRTDLEKIENDIYVMDKNIESDKEAIAETERHLASLRAKVKSSEEGAKALKEIAGAAHEKVDILVDPDMAIFDTRLLEVEKTNEEVRSNIKYIETKTALDGKQKESAKLTASIDALDKTKTDAIKAAKFPIEALSFDDAGVLYKGMPFAQCSSAERLRVSLAMAMAMNPKLRVIRIMDGSLLDSHNMAVIKEMAEDKDFQVWIECVDESGKVGIVIEDGQVVKSAEEKQGALL